MIRLNTPDMKRRLEIALDLVRESSEEQENANEEKPLKNEKLS